MKRPALTRLVIGGLLILLLSLGCGIFTFAPTPTPTPTFTATSIPTSTPRPTETPVPGPKPGTWSGPGATFTLTEYGQVQDLKLVFEYGDSTCTYSSFDNIPVVHDAFDIHVTTTSQNFIDLFDTDEAMYISGTFEEATSLSGTWGALMCGEQITFSINAEGKFGPVTGEWSASWRGPLADSASGTCPYAGADDTQTFTNLILAEEQSVLNEDLGLVRSIFTDGATIKDVGEGQAWTDVIEHYQELFDTLDFEQLTHFDIEVVKKIATRAWVKATSGGTLVVSSSGERIEWQSEPGSDHYTFGKSSAGCWLISHFSKNAASETFP